MYTKHHTKALVLASHNSGEADKIYALLTPDFGKVYAKAHGVREHKARHKGALQTLSEAHVSLVRGKSGWRVTNVTSHRSLYAELTGDTIRLAVLIRVLKLVRRLVAGEGSADKVFSIVDSFSEILTRETLTRETMSLAETLSVLRLLSVLGYLRHNERFTGFLSDVDDLSDSTIVAFAPHLKEAVKALNESLEATQL
jgi:recombinational DNA repair protein (RecF pathway)